MAGLALACAHAPAPPAAEARAWPPPPAQPRARWAGSLPPERSEQPSGFTRFLRAVLGTSDEPSGPALARPFGLVLAGGTLVTADPDLPGVFRLPEDGPPQPVTCREREWAAPMALAAGPDGTLFVADGGAPAVVRVGPAGECRAFGGEVLERPTGLAFQASRLYVVDPPRHRIVAFTPDGREVRRFGEEGEGDGQLYFPTAIAAAPDGTLLVVDALNFRVCRFSPEGSFLGAFGERGDEAGRLARPKAIAVTPDGRIYVSDAQRGVVLAFTRRGAFDFELGEPGKAPGQLDQPAGLAVAGDRLHVASSLNHRIERYLLLGEAP